MWQACEIYDLETHRFISNEEIEAAREAAYQTQQKRVEQLNKQK